MGGKRCEESVALGGCSHSRVHVVVARWSWGVRLVRMLLAQTTNPFAAPMSRGLSSGQSRRQHQSPNPSLDRTTPAMLPSLARMSAQRAPTPFSTAHKSYVQSLYRRYLKNALNWFIRRDLWRQRAIEIRADLCVCSCWAMFANSIDPPLESRTLTSSPLFSPLFPSPHLLPTTTHAARDSERNRNIRNPRELARVLQEAEENLKKVAHPDPYRRECRSAAPLNERCGAKEDAHAQSHASRSTRPFPIQHPCSRTVPSGA